MMPFNPDNFLHSRPLSSHLLPSHLAGQSSDTSTLLSECPPRSAGGRSSDGDLVSFTSRGITYKLTRPGQVSCIRCQVTGGRSLNAGGGDELHLSPAWPRLAKDREDVCTYILMYATMMTAKSMRAQVDVMSTTLAGKKKKKKEKSNISKLVQHELDSLEPHRCRRMFAGVS